MFRKQFWLILILCSNLALSNQNVALASGVSGRLEPYEITFLTSQDFIVPSGVNEISVVATAGSGGTSAFSELTTGGKGAQILGSISVVEGDLLAIEVGLEGGEDNGGYPFDVYSDKSLSWSQAGGSETRISFNQQLLLVAGGGGGGVLGENNKVNYGGNAGLVAEDGSPSSANSISGAGGSAGTNSPGLGGAKEVIDSSYCGDLTSGFPADGTKGGKGGSAGKVTMQHIVTRSGGGGGGGGYQSGGGGGGSCGSNIGATYSYGVGGGGGAGSSWTSSSLQNSVVSTSATRGDGKVVLSFIREMFNPNAPTASILSHDHTSVSIAWTEPNYYGFEITSYTVYFRPSGTNSWTAITDITSTSRNRQITGLQNGANYEFFVAAINSKGEGKPSNIVFEKPSSKCEIAGIFFTINSDKSINIKFDVNDNGSQHSKVTTKYSINDSQYQNLGLDGSLEAVIPEQLTGTKVVAKGSCTNRDGQGSEKSSQLIIDGKPLAPQVSISSYNKQYAKLVWTAPVSFGDQITKYSLLITDNRGNSITKDYTGQSAELTNLELNSLYSFMVRGTNSLGTGAWSNQVTLETDVAIEISGTLLNFYVNGETRLPFPVANIFDIEVPSTGWQLQKYENGEWIPNKTIYLSRASGSCASSESLSIDVEKDISEEGLYKIYNPTWRNAESNSFEVPKTLNVKNLKINLTSNSNTSWAHGSFSAYSLKLWRESPKGDFPALPGTKVTLSQAGSSGKLKNIFIGEWTRDVNLLSKLALKDFDCSVESADKYIKLQVPKVFPNAENRDAKKLVLTAESSTKSDSISIDLKWPAYKKTEVKMISLGLVGAKITYKTLGTDGNFIRRPGTYLLQYRKSRTSSWKTIDKDSSQGRGKFLLTVGLDGWYRIINPVGNVIHDAYWAYSV